MSKRKLPYADRDDLNKMQSQWNKLSGLRKRKEWSASIVRAATAAEIAANIAIRREFSERSQFEPQFVDNLLRCANGLAGKLDRLLIPMTHEPVRLSELRRLKSTAGKLNKIRNGVVHQGEFASRKKANQVIDQCEKFIDGLLAPYIPDFSIVDVLNIESESSKHIGNRLSTTKVKEPKRRARKV